MKRIVPMLLGALLAASPVRAGDELVIVRQASGADVPYILTDKDGNRPTHAVVLMPGGTGQLNARMQDGKLAFGFSGNFLIRTRVIFAGGRFVTASTDASSSVPRMLAIVEDLERRWPGIQTYIAGTSRSSLVTMSLSQPLDGRVAGFIHSSSMNPIASFDTRSFKSRHLIVTHTGDVCRATRADSSLANHRAYGTPIIVMEGGKSVGDECDAWSHHGYNGVERATVERIKAWILGR
jgi:hypothetical protein